jgi:hypothetical protein
MRVDELGNTGNDSLLALIHAGSTGIANNSAGIVINTNAFSVLDTNLTALTSTVSSHTTSISTFTPQIGNLLTTVGGLITITDNLDTRLDTAEDDITALELIGSNALFIDGTRSMTDDLDLDGNDIIGVNEIKTEAPTGALTLPRNVIIRGTQAEVGVGVINSLEFQNDDISSSGEPQGCKIESYSSESYGSINELHFSVRSTGSYWKTLEISREGLHITSRELATPAIKISRRFSSSQSAISFLNETEETDDNDPEKWRIGMNGVNDSYRIIDNSDGTSVFEIPYDSRKILIGSETSSTTGSDLVFRNGTINANNANTIRFSGESDLANNIGYRRTGASTYEIQN